MMNKPTSFLDRRAVFVVLLCLASGTAYADTWYTFAVDFGDIKCPCLSGAVGVWDLATIDFDDTVESSLEPADDGYAGFYHQQDVDGWTAPTGWYQSDLRRTPLPMESRVWNNLYVWASSNYTDPTMQLSFAPDLINPPTMDRAYTLTLLEVPDDVVGAPNVGTAWDIPASESFALDLPTHATEDGLTGYRFSFTINVPEPTSLACALLAMTLVLSRRRC